MMKEEIKMTIKNNFCTEPRSINVYHHAAGSAHMISHNSSVTLPLRAFSQDDYLYIAVVNGPGPLCKQTVIDLPGWADFEFVPGGEINLIHSDGRILLNMPPGQPGWQLKIRQAALPGTEETDSVTIGDSAIS